MSEQLFVSPRSFVMVLEGTGLTARFEAGVPRPLRPNMQPMAPTQGVLPATDDVVSAIQRSLASSVSEAEAEKEAEPLPDGTPDPGVSVSEAVAKMVKEGNPEYFDTAGRPRVRELEKLTGQKVSSTERDDAWAQYEEV